MHRRGTLGSLAVAGTTVLVGLALTGTAHAATNCTHGGNGRQDWSTCHNLVGTNVYGGVGPSPKTDGIVYPNQVVGHLYSNPSWFECRIDNGPWNGGGPHPYRWLYTESDDG